MSTATMSTDILSNVADVALIQVIQARLASGKRLERKNGSPKGSSLACQEPPRVAPDRQVFISMRHQHANAQLCDITTFMLKMSYYATKRQRDIRVIQYYASFCCQVAAWVPDMFCNFYLVKNHKIAKNSTTSKAREKNKYRFGIFRIFYVRLTKFKNNQILLNKISRRILLTTKVFTG